MRDQHEREVDMINMREDRHDQHERGVDMREESTWDQLERGVARRLVR